MKGWCEDMEKTWINEYVLINKEFHDYEAIKMRQKISGRVLEINKLIMKDN